ncbi:MAG: hypothetical protein KC776_22580 [Myxococcales bacterium]|nr:hypothetical protein [Myxococcales bacterium]MCB9579336.1 hypothetical protein [Polyangiaceae bacterium]
MNARRVRLQKLAKLRQKQLDERVGEFGRATEREQSARERALLEYERHDGAVALRQGAAQAPVEGSTWAEANEWLELCGLYRDAAGLALSRAETAREQARNQVLAARQALQRIEVLDQRLKQHEDRANERKERRLHDELAQRSRKGSR